MKISIFVFAFLLSAIAYAQDRPATFADLHTDYTVGIRADYAFGRCGLLIFDFETLPHWRDNGIPLAEVKRDIDETITHDLDNPDTDAESESVARYRWRRVIAATPKDMADWNAVIEKLYVSEITEKQIDSVLKKYCAPHTKHVFRASDLSSLLSKSKSQQEKSDAYIAPGTDTDYTCVNGLQRKGVSYKEAMARCTFQQ